MSWRIKRIDPYWVKTPIVYAGAAASAVLGIYGAAAGSTGATLIGAAGFAVAIFFAVRPALSAVFAAFGVVGGIVAFIASPGTGNVFVRLASTAGFGVLYMVVMDVVLLGVSALYNAFTRAGFPGLSLGLES